MLKIGVHVGPAYRVTLNNRLDYFGTSVNIAARAQREAPGGEIAATNDLLAESSDVMNRFRLALVPFDIKLKGISEPVQLMRIQLLADELSVDPGPSVRSEVAS